MKFLIKAALFTTLICCSAFISMASDANTTPGYQKAIDCSIHQGEIVDGFQLTAELYRYSVPKGVGIGLKVVLKNVSDRDRTFTDSDAPHDYHISIKPSNGERVEILREAGRLYSSAEMPLQPNEERVAIYKIGEKYHFAEKGFYVITAGRHVTDMTGKENAVVVSNPVPFSLPEPESIKIAHLNEEQYIKVAPEEFKAYDSAKASGSEKAALDAALRLVEKTYQVWQGRENDKQCPQMDRSIAGSAHEMAWSRVIEVASGAKDESIKGAAIDGWNKALTNCPTRPQVDSLEDTWNPDFVTEPYIKLFMSCKDPGMICDFCGVLGMYGEDREEQILRDKLASLPSVIDKSGKDYKIAVSAIEGGLKKIGYWHQFIDRLGPHECNH